MDKRLVQEDLEEEAFVIMELYESFVNYVYPISLNMNRRHIVLRDMFAAALLDLPRQIYQAGKSTSLSKLYTADASIAYLRFLLRTMVNPKHGLLKPNQHKTASDLLSHVGKVLGSWIKKQKPAKKDDRG